MYRTKDIQQLCRRFPQTGTRTGSCGQRFMRQGIRGMCRGQEFSTPMTWTTFVASYGTRCSFHHGMIVASTPRWRRRRSQMERVHLASFGSENVGTGQFCVYGLLPTAGGTDRGAEWREDLSSGRSCDANLEPCVRSTYLSRCPKQHAGAGRKDSRDGAHDAYLHCS